MMCTKLQDLTVVKFSWGKTSGLSDVVRRLPKVFLKVPKLPLHHCGDVLCVSVGKSDGEESSDDDSDSSDQEQQTWLAELNWRRKHPECLHEELWFNLPQEVCLQWASYVIVIHSGCVLFQNLTNLDRSKHNVPHSQSNLICSDASEKIWLSHAHLYCRASGLSLSLPVKEGVVCGALRKFGADENKMTTPTNYDQKDLCVLFHWTGSISSDKYLSDFEKESNQYWCLEPVHRC